MSITKTQVFKTLRPDIPSWVDSGTKEAILDEVGRYVTTEIALYVGDGKSPVEGYGSFKKLTEEYSEEEKGGDKNPNLELHGDMIGALEWRVEMDEVKVGIFKEEQAIKAYGHNTGMKGHPWLDGKAPMRRFIPDKEEAFVKEITTGIQNIIDEALSQIEREQEDESEEATGTSGRSETPSGFRASTNWLDDDDDDDGGWL